MERTVKLVKETIRTGKRDTLDMIWHELVTSGNERRFVDVIEWSRDEEQKVRFLVRVWEHNA